jgi:hypothetical protein
MPVPGHTTVFGLDVCANRPLPFLVGGSRRACGRPLRLSAAAAGRELRWPSDASLICDERGPDGEVVFQIQHSSLGFRIAGPRYGEAIVAADGSSVRGAPGPGGLREWQRLLVAQVLPFAAVLRGLEVLHASAVVFDGETVAVLGPSGAGKTSVAVALGRRGGVFLADDVLAVSRQDGRLFGHPGPAVAGIHSEEAERLRRGDGLDPERLLGENAREAMVRMTPWPDPAPLRAIFVLERRAEGPSRPYFEPVVSPTVLLSATFNLLLQDPRRLTTLLDVCADASRGLVERVVVGPRTDAVGLADSIADRIGAGR